MSSGSETKIERRMKLIILDFDGTLADTRGLIVKTMQQTLDALGLEPRTDDQCAAMIGLPLKQAFTDLLPMTDEMGEQCVETYRRIFNANNALYVIPTFPHVMETLHQLQCCDARWWFYSHRKSCENRSEQPVLYTQSSDKLFGASRTARNSLPHYHWR